MWTRERSCERRGQQETVPQSLEGRVVVVVVVVVTFRSLPPSHFSATLSHSAFSTLDLLTRRD